MIRFVVVVAFFAAILGLLTLSSAFPVLAFAVASVAGVALMVLYFLAGRRTVLNGMHPDELEAP